MKAVIAAGGTAGHINPALAIAGAIMDNEKGSEVVFFGREDGMEKKLVEQAGGEVVGLRFAIELSSEFDGRTPLAGYDVQSVMQY